MSTELVFETRSSGLTLGLHEPLDGGAVLEEAGCSTGIAHVSRGGELHAACIGTLRRTRNPWRE